VRWLNSFRRGDGARHIWWDGGYGTSWFTHPARGRIGILLTQTSNVLWNGTTQEFAQLALRA
jgi:hypothetical protein